MRIKCKEGCLVDDIYWICNIYKVKGGYVVYTIYSYTTVYIILWQCRVQIDICTPHPLYCKYWLVQVHSG